MSEHECDRILRLEIEAAQHHLDIRNFAEIVEELKKDQLEIKHGINNIKWFLIGFGVWLVASQLGFVDTIKAFL